MTEPALRPRRVLVPGETMLLLTGEPGMSLELTDSFRASTAGAETNVAVGLSRLGHRARWLGRLGNDAIGHSVLRRLRAEGIELDDVVLDSGAPTGVLIRDVHPGREIQVGYYRSGSAASRWSADDVRREVLTDVDLVHLTGITAMLSPAALGATRRLIELTRAAGVPLSIDPNIRLRVAPIEAWRETMLPLLCQASTVLAGSDELEMLGTTAAQLLAEGVEIVVLKESDKSVTAHSASAEVRQPAHVVAAQDSVGAGDAFAAGYLSGVLEDLPLADCLARGAKVASFVVQTIGDVEGLPRRGELLRSLRTTESGVVHR